MREIQTCEDHKTHSRYLSSISWRESNGIFEAISAGRLNRCNAAVVKADPSHAVAETGQTVNSWNGLSHDLRLSDTRSEGINCLPLQPQPQDSEETLVKLGAEQPETDGAAS